MQIIVEWKFNKERGSKEWLGELGHSSGSKRSPRSSDGAAETLAAAH